MSGVARDPASLDPANPDPAGTGALPPSLLLLGVAYGGMVTIAGVLGTKQVALGPLAVEAGIFPFLTLVALSSAVAQLHGRTVAERLVRCGFVPLIGSIALALLVLALPADPGMYPPARAAFPIVMGQGWRMMAAGVVAYGVSVRLNVWLFSRLAGRRGASAPLRGAIAAALSQIVDAAMFITISFAGVRALAPLLLGQIVAKVVLSAVLVPPLIAQAVAIGRRVDRG